MMIDSTTLMNEDDDSFELQLLKKIRLALAATLHMLECIRDDVGILGQRMDRLCAASQQCRRLLQEQGHLRRVSQRRTQPTPQVPLSSGADADAADGKLPVADAKDDDDSMDL
jgi:hypothetical protein